MSCAGLFFVFILALILIFCFLKLLIRKWPVLRAMAGSLWQALAEAVKNNAHVVQWTQRHPRLVSFLRARFDQSAFSGLPLTASTTALVYVLGLLSGIVEDLITSSPIVTLDLRFSNLFVAFRTDPLTDLSSRGELTGGRNRPFVEPSGKLTPMYRADDYGFHFDL